MRGSYLVHHLLENSAERYPDKIAIKDGGRTISYQQLHEESVKIANIINECKIGKGERVGILLDKSIEQVLSFFGISFNSNVSVFINPILKKEQVEHILQDCGARILITAK
jgi:acyl-CoA synthetase (AMP-forming)/AMP-acid ligase II